MVPQQYFLGHDQYLLEVEDPNCRLWRKKYREREREGERERERESCLNWGENFSACFLSVWVFYASLRVLLFLF